MSEALRYQVAEVKYGYAVRDTRTGHVVTRTYTTTGWAVRAAIKLNASINPNRRDYRT